MKTKFKKLTWLPIIALASLGLQACSGGSANAHCDTLSALADQFNGHMNNGNYEMAFSTVRSIYFEIKDEPEVDADESLAGRIENTKGMANLIVNGGADAFGVSNVLSTIQSNMTQIKAMCQ
ncbi:hypothetical protein MCEJIRE27_00488 [Candidatus Nanopelagicaceae bacterium]